MAGPSTPRSASTVTVVNVATDDPLATGATGCDTDRTAGGLQCSLRAALTVTQQTGGGTVTFSKAMTITTGSPLPQLSVPVDVDGTTVAGFAGGARVVVTRGAAAAVSHAFVLLGAGSSVSGLTVSGFVGQVHVDADSHEPAAAVLLGGADGSVTQCLLTDNEAGVWVDRAPGAVVGTTDGGANRILRSGEAGVLLVGAGTTDAAVVGNTVDGGRGTGIRFFGTTSAPSPTDGPRRALVRRNVVTGTTAPSSGGFGTGVGILVGAGSGTSIVGNTIGLTAAGSISGNVDGIRVIEAAATVIGTATAGEGNTVSGNSGVGILVGGSATTDTTLRNNRVGTDAAGTSARANGTGIVVTSAGPEVAGPLRTTIAGTVVAASSGDGLQLTQARSTTLTGLTVGADASRTRLLGNAGVGLRLTSVDDLTLTGSVVVGNDSGMTTAGTATSPTRKVVVTGSAFGTDLAGTAALGNRHAGVAALDGTADVRLGGDRFAPNPTTTSRCPLCNVIAFNAGSGIQVQDDPTVPATTTGVSSRGNLLHDNGILGIDLVSHGPGEATPTAVTPNDSASRDGTTVPLDADDGGNGLLNAPIGVLRMTRPHSSELGLTGQRAVSGRVVGIHPEDTIVDVYGSPATAPAVGDGISHYGQAGTWLGAAAPRPDGTWSLSLPAALVASAGVVGATVTTEGPTTLTTSELSATCLPVVTGQDPDSDADGLCDEWELHGLDADRDGTADLLLRGLGAGVGTKDVFVENDRLALAGVPRPNLASLGPVVDAFAASVGGGVALHTATHVEPAGQPASHDPWVDESLDDAAVPGGSLAAYEVLDGAGLRRLRDGDPRMPCDGVFGTAEDRALDDRSCASHLLARSLVYRWALWGYQLAAGADVTGIGQIGGGSLAIGIGAWTDAEVVSGQDRQRCGAVAPVCRDRLAGQVFMHELGHTLGLLHGGDDSRNFKPNYLSIMNYALAFENLDVRRPLDYSAFELPALDKTALSEPDGLTAGAAWPADLAAWTRSVTMFVDPRDGTCRLGTINARGPVNWNHVRGATETSVVANVNAFTERAADDSPLPDPTPPGPDACSFPLRAGTPQVIVGHDDWHNLDLDLRWAEMSYAAFTGPSVAGDLGRVQALALARRSDSDADGVPNADDVCPTVADPGQADADGDHLGDACVAAVTDRDVTVTAPATRSAPVGSTVTVPVTLRNGSARAATGLGVQLRLPSSLTVVSAGSPVGSVSGSGAARRWTVASLAPRASAVLTVTARVTAPDATDLVAELMTADQPDPTSAPGNGTAGEDDLATTLVTGTAVAGAAPALGALSPTTAVQGAPWSGATSFTDADSSTWTATTDTDDGRGPQPATVDAAARRVSSTATFAGTGAQRVTVCVTDAGGRRGCRTTTVQVSASVPTAAVAVDLTPSGPVPAVVTAVPGQTVRFTRSDGAASPVRAADGAFDSGAWAPTAAYAVAPRGSGATAYARGDGATGLVVTTCPTQDGLDAQETAFVAGINGYRRSLGLAPLGLSRTATAAALRQARDVASTGVPWHTGSDGSGPADRMAQAGYPATPVAENLLQDVAASTAASALAAWKSSPEHDATMRGAGWRAMGIARARGTDGSWFWVTTFGPVDDCASSAGVAPAVTTTPATVAVGGDVVIANRSQRADGVSVAVQLDPGTGAAASALAAGAARTVTYGSGGTKTVVATVAGVRARTTVGVGVVPTLTYAGPTTVAPGSTFTATAVVTRSDTGAAAAGVTVSFGWNGATTTAVTGSTGRASSVLTTPSARGARTLTLTSSPSGTLLAGRGSASVTVDSPTLAPTVVSWTGPSSVAAGTALLATATVSRADGSGPVAGAVVTYALPAGGGSASGTTGSDGRASATLTAPPSPGSVTLGIAAGATASTSASSTSATLAVTAAPTVAVAYQGPRWLVTQRASALRAVVTSAADGTPVPGRTVRFALGGVTRTATTGADGAATAAFTPTATGADASLTTSVLEGSVVSTSVATPVTVVTPGTSRLVAGRGTGPWATVGSQVVTLGTAGRSGIVYVADRVSNAVLRIDTVSAPAVATVAIPASTLATFLPDDSFYGVRGVGLAVDAAGRVYVADAGHHRVLRWDPGTGATSVVAGTGVAGFTGDGGAATAAQLSTPSGVALDPSGRLLVADSGNARVRSVSPAGTISTVLGAGAPGAAGATTLVAPVSVTVPAGATVAVLDQRSNAVRQLSTAGVVTTPFSGDSVSIIRGLTTDPAGHLLVAQDRQLTSVSGTTATVVLSSTPPASFVDRPGEGAAPGDGLAFFGPLGRDGTTVLFAQRSGWNLARRITGFGTGSAVVTTVMGSSAAGFTGTQGAAATSVLLGEPSGLTVDRASGSTLVMDPRAYRVFRLPTDGTISTLGGNPVSQGAICANTASSGFLSLPTQLFCAPTDITQTADGLVTLLDTGHGQVLQVQRGLGSALTLLAGTPQTTGNTGEGVPASAASLQGAEGVAWSPDGSLLVVDTRRHRLRQVASGVVTTVIGTGSAGFSGDGGPAASAQLWSPRDAAYDVAGNLYIADTGNHRIRKVAAGTGIITTVAGTGIPGFSGDGGPGLAARLNAPTDVLPLGTSALLIADRLNHRVRLLDLATGTISTVAGTGATDVVGAGSAATATGVPWPTKLATDGGGTVLVSSQRGGSQVDFLGSGWPASWNNGVGTGAVLRFSLPSGR